MFDFCLLPPNEQISLQVVVVVETRTQVTLDDKDADDEDDDSYLLIIDLNIKYWLLVVYHEIFID